MLVKQKLIGVFEKKYKNMSTKQESVSDATFKARPFSSNFHFASKLGRVTTATCKYCPIGCRPYHYQLLQRAPS